MRNVQDIGLRLELPTLSLDSRTEDELRALEGAVRAYARLRWDTARRRNKALFGDIKNAAGLIHTRWPRNLSQFLNGWSVFGTR